MHLKMKFYFFERIVSSVLRKPLSAFLM